MTARLGTVCVLVAALACARATARRQPTSLRDYELVVEGRDSLRDAIALALRHARFHVRRALKGASPPTAALVLFSFRDDSTSHDWLHARFFDTRSGAIVAAASIPVDSTVRDGRGRARALVDALVVVRHAP